MSSNLTEEKEGFIYAYHNDFTVIKPIDHSPAIPTSCPVCDFVLSDSSDDIAYNKHGCCFDCMQRWVEPNRKKWNSGWRPDANQIKKQQKEKQSMPISFYLENT